MSQSTDHVAIPGVKPSATNQAQLQRELLASETMREYRGIFAMLLMQGLLADTIKVDQLDPTQQATTMNMITDTIGVRAAELAAQQR